MIGKTIFLSLIAGSSLILANAQVTRSSLADGDVYKLGVRKEGIHIITYESLEQLGLNPTTIDPRQIKLLGQSGGVLPEAIDSARISDLAEIPILVVGEDDGNFDPTDYILFYGQGPNRWIFAPDEEVFVFETNPYDFRNYYFIKIGGENGVRIAPIEVLSSAEYETSTYLSHQHYELEQHNLLHFADNANLQGSGRRWLGDLFRTDREKDFTDQFDFDDIQPGEPLHIRSVFAARSSVASNVIYTIGDQQISRTISSARTDEIEADYAKLGSITQSLNFSNTPSVKVSYPDQGNNNIGWLDFITLNFRRTLNYTGNQLIFADPESINASATRYQLLGVNEGDQIWEVTDPMRPGIVAFESSGSVNFAVSSNRLRRFIAFEQANALPVEPVGKIEPQNLHALGGIDYLMIYHPDFENAAKKLAEFRQTQNGYRVGLATIDQVLNEFSSGRVDPTAIRDFARYLYIKEVPLKYMLLFGDGSFDYRHIYSDLSDESFIPVWETNTSLHPITAFPSDDYYALLEDGEGGTLRGDLDIAVGRIPIRTPDEANLVVDKIIKYETADKTLGNWRINTLFVADDEDNDRHLVNADNIAESVARKYPFFNINKIYIDAFAQENTPGGVFNFKAKEAINQSLFKGQLVVNYLGHGGSNGWAQERILQREDIDTWNNIDRLPLLITATCSFAGYDNPKKITAGELTISNPNGGAIALFTTVRAVYANSNERLTESVFNHLFAPTNGKIPAIGDILKNSKNSRPSDISNARKFTLLGDPALRLAMPDYKVRTTKINGKAIDLGSPDTLKALKKITVSGEVLTADGQLATGFNGKIYPTIFDKALTLKTLAQDKGSSEREFRLQKSVIFKGLVSVVNGQFEFTFVVPKDINYVYGEGKISYYAEDGTPVDAAGSFNDIVVGGTDPNGLTDETGPEIEIFMDNEDFVFGGIISSNPTLLLKLSDDNGINVIGNSIGHDLTAIIDNNFQNTIVLNDFYEAEQDDYRAGRVSYPLSNLDLGQHSITIKAWDIANNSSESFSEFVVVNEAQSGLRHVLNYPNPFNESTCFQFEHQFPNVEIDIRVDILTVSGRLVKTLEQTVKASSTLSRDVKWDGRDEYGDPLANGIYIYRVTIKAEGGSGQILKNRSELEKLVILR